MWRRGGLTALLKKRPARPDPSPVPVRSDGRAGRATRRDTRTVRPHREGRGRGACEGRSAEAPNANHAGDAAGPPRRARFYLALLSALSLSTTSRGNASRLYAFFAFDPISARGAGGAKGEGRDNPQPRPPTDERRGDPTRHSYAGRGPAAPIHGAASELCRRRKHLRYVSYLSALSRHVNSRKAASFGSSIALRLPAASRCRSGRP